MVHNKLRFEDRTTEITVDELRELDSFKSYTEEQAKNLINTMKAFARIVYNIMAQEKTNAIIDNKTINISITEQLNEAA